MAANSFSIDLSRFANRTEQQLKTLVQRIAMEAFKGVILKTAVDTGAARGGWSVAIGSPPTTRTGRIDKSGSAAISEANQVTAGWNCTGSIFLANSLPYIATLEYGGYPNPPKYGSIPKGLKKGKNPNGFRVFYSAGGFSIQSPAGMVRVTVAEIAAHYKGV